VSDLLFVLPEKRGAIAAKKLVQDFIQWAIDNGVPNAFIGVSVGIDNERTGKFFEKMGFHHVGLSYKMELNNV
ncbi:GNAT family N-acetyltransferase, partial [bacterium]|nr:GNAT family N-acetyltransferase [bacterium]